MLVVTGKRTTRTKAKNMSEENNVPILNFNTKGVLQHHLLTDPTDQSIIRSIKYLWPFVVGEHTVYRLL